MRRALDANRVVAVGHFYTLDMHVRRADVEAVRVWGLPQSQRLVELKQRLGLE